MQTKRPPEKGGFKIHRVGPFCLPADLVGIRQGKKTGLAHTTKIRRGRKRRPHRDIRGQSSWQNEGELIQKSGGKSRTK